eukprot:CAMPEP_0116034874 /NCGR_PEP_ID=MMETSP0321-20121206/19951_1 /TAXON_ID=163516 /ORGANISM="Leptocylindrus danicus var. danicus, Strain B650" /LENGTH=290 /DNA_ID=CAMNT_0003511437 /DNA_START=203 /DNA_END=1076 /DNA_ORIENTATION=+
MATQLAIAGYTAFAISIPLSFLSAVVEQPYLRSMLTRDRPQDDTWGNALVNFLRTYWVEDGLFEGETAYQIAKDLALNRLMDYDVPVRILAGTSTSTSFGDEVEVRSLPSTIPAAGDFVWKAFYGGDHAMEGARVFVEFMDVANDKNEGDISEQRNEGLISGSSGSTDIVFSDEISAFNKQASTVDDEDQKLLHLMQGFSLWHYWPSAADESLSPSDQKSGGQTSETGGGKMSTEQIRISELEWQEAQLQMQMIDPNCTREIDAMESELADVRRELRSLKGGWTSWFRRK